jgi:hypothetical protein
MLVLARGVPALVRAYRSLGGEDRAGALLQLVVRGLPAERAEWGDAMLAEFAGMAGGRARWMFGLGCARAALALRTRAAVAAPGRGGDGLRALALAGVLAALALGVAGLVRYPEIRSDTTTWGALASLTAIMLAYAWGALTLARGATREAATARALGLAGGLVVGGAWLLILAPAAASKSLVFVPLTAALLAPACVAALTRRAGADARAARQAALWSGILGALIAFVVWVTAAYARDGRPYDAQMLRDFHASGSHDLAAYAVGDAFGTGLSVLVIVPVVALALGSLAGCIAPRALTR